MTAQIWLKRALLLIVIGLIVQLFCLLKITPASFLLFAGVGVGAVVVGLGLFVVALVRRQREASEQAREVDDAA